MAMYCAPFPIYKLLFEKGGSTEHGQLLLQAVRRECPDRIEAARYIMNKGGLRDLNKAMYQDSLGYWVEEMMTSLETPLHGAAKDGLLDMIELLLERRANPFIKDSKGLLPIDRRRNSGHNKAVKRLSQLRCS